MTRPFTPSYFYRGLALTTILAASSLAAQAQGVRIGAAGAPDASAILELVSGSKGVLLPRVADVAAIASPVAGLIAYQTGGTAGYYYYTGTGWQQIATAAGAAITASNGLIKTGQNVALGGSLANPTTIAQAGNAFSLTGGSVGIGTATPQSTLEVSGDFRVSSGVVNASLGTTGAPNANISGTALGQSFTMPVAGTVTSVRLVAGNNSFNATFQIYSGSGNVGTAQLAAPQPISFTANTTTTVALATPVALAAGVYTLVINTGSNNLLYFNSGDRYTGGNLYQGTASLSPYDLDFTIAYSSGTATSAFNVAPNGNVGIGTSSAPAQKLEVAGGSIKISTAGQGLIFPNGSTQTAAGLAAVAASAPFTGTGTAASPLALPQVSSSTDGYLSSANYNQIQDNQANTNVRIAMVQSDVSMLGNQVSNTENNVAVLSNEVSTKFTLPALASGSVLFSNGSTIAQKNAQLFWDNTNNRLGVGTAAPTSTLQVGGAVALPYTTTGNTAGTFTLTAAHHTVRRFGPCNNIVIPQPGTCPGRIYTIISSNGSGSNVGLNVQTSGGVYDDVNGAPVTFLTPNQRLSIQSDGTDWIVIGR